MINCNTNAIFSGIGDTDQFHFNLGIGRSPVFNSDILTDHFAKSFCVKGNLMEQFKAKQMKLKGKPFCVAQKHKNTLNFMEQWTSGSLLFFYLGRGIPANITINYENLLSL